MDDKAARTLAQRTRMAIRPLLVLASSAILASTVSESNDLIQQIESRYNSARTLSVNFVENYSVLGHPRPPESGILTLRKQGKMRWDYTRPQGKLFISDGKNVFLYMAEDNRVEKVPLKATEDMRAPLAFLLGRLDLKKEFQNFEVKAGDGGEWLNASAKSDRLPYKGIQMLIGPGGSIRELKVLGRDESLLSFSFSGERINPAVSDRIFHFAIPPGAQVVDSIQFGSQEK